MTTTKILKFRDVPIGRMFQFRYQTGSKFYGTFKKISARKFTDGKSEYTCAVSAPIYKIED